MTVDEAQRREPKAQTADSKPSAVDEVVEHLRVLIRERGLGVGDVLPSEVELADMFTASRGTVREAFRTLKAYGVA